ncbi:MAG: aminotransferase class I/II-fold pyridoxal phosphate-dependent enzyme [Bdellovibrionota bacterium]
MIAEILERELHQRRELKEFRTVKRRPSDDIDFSSNDYLGLIHSGELDKSLRKALVHAPEDLYLSGAGSSRLIAGSSRFIEEFEEWLAHFYGSESALLFTSGYSANLGLISSLGALSDFVFLYDEQSHASIRDGFRLARVKSYRFAHNDLNNLEGLLKAQKKEVIIFVEAVYSMEGDTAPLPEIVELAEQYGAHVVVDEAHAVGVYGTAGDGMTAHMDLTDRVLARVCGWGKAHGCQGATIVTTTQLRDFLINFSRPFIYSTGISPLLVLTAQCSYQIIQKAAAERTKLFHLITTWNEKSISEEIIRSQNLSPIQTLQFDEMTERNTDRLRELVVYLQEHHFHIVPIYPPTVPRGGERIRISLHNFNSFEEVSTLIQLSEGFVAKGNR